LSEFASLFIVLSIYGGSLHAQEVSQLSSPAPQNFFEHVKSGGANPFLSVEENTDSDSTASASAAPSSRKENGFVGKLRDLEGSALSGIFIKKNETPSSMTGDERRNMYLKQTLTTPGAFMKRMFGAGVDQARGSPSQWQGGWGGYGERFASREGQFITANSIAALGNAALKYEPRYDQCKCSGFWPRTRHAITRDFLTYHRTEQKLRPQWALFGGSVGGALVSSTWKPHPRSVAADIGWAVLGQAGYGSLLNFAFEFSGEIGRKIGARTKK
jgi:hypothetical protein